MFRPKPISLLPDKDNGLDDIGRRHPHTRDGDENTVCYQPPTIKSYQPYQSSAIHWIGNRIK
jgi:hypothetical protein